MSYSEEEALSNDVIEGFVAEDVQVLNEDEMDAIVGGVSISALNLPVKVLPPSMCH